MYYKIDENHSWNTDTHLKDMTGIVFKSEKVKKTKITWYNRRKDIWSYFIESDKDKTDFEFWTGRSSSICSYSKCTKKEAEEMLGYKI